MTAADDPDLPEPIHAARPTFTAEQRARISADLDGVLQSGRLILGPHLKRLEEEWAARFGTHHAVGLSSCTAALEIALRHARVAGRDVIVPANTFVATASAALGAGARVVFCDMSADDFCIDVDDAISKLGSNTAAVIVVHIAGFISAKIDSLVQACRARGVAVIEDCAHAHGAELRESGAPSPRPAGSLGNAGCFSLYPTKVLTCGVGGVLTTNDDALASFARMLRHHGQVPGSDAVVELGNDWLMDEVHAVIARTQLDRLNDVLSIRRRLAGRYTSLLASDPKITLPRLDSRLTPAYYKFPVLVPEGTSGRTVRRALWDEHRVEAGGLYDPPCHLMPAFVRAANDRVLGAGRDRQPIAERTLARQVCLPMHTELTPEDVERSVAALRDVVR